MPNPRPLAVHNVRFAGANPFVLIAGPCVIEDRDSTLRIARSLHKLTRELGIPLVFKASYDKANRSSLQSFRGVGQAAGLDILREVRESLDVPVTSDIHSPEEAAQAGAVLDILQIPAFLCRQTDLLTAAGETGRAVNVKKGQFLSPWHMKGVAEKVLATGNKRLLLTERGTTFGYENLVTDFRSIAVMRELGHPVVIDASHSVQQPGALGNASGGRREFIPLIARCGIAAGADAVFMEVHPHPDQAPSDGPNMWPLGKLRPILQSLLAIHKAVRHPAS